jgi:hypothetical protein
VYHYAGNNPVKLVDPDGNQTALPFPIPWSIPLPQMGPLLPPIIIAPALEAEEPKPPTLDDPDIDMGDTKTWPKPPGEGPFVEGDTSRAKPRERGEKSLFDKGGGEWRPHRPDKHHPKGHWDYKPSANPDGDKNPQWRDVYPEEHGYPPPRFLPPSGSTEEPAT